MLDYFLIFITIPLGYFRTKFHYFIKTSPYKSTVHENIFIDFDTFYSDF
jgi:hypothetical protein